MKLQWRKITFKAQGITGWIAFKKAAELEKENILLTDRAVYVIRVQRPFSFSYPERHSPVAYIGKGQFQKRITAHLKSWIKHLAKRFPDLKIDIYYCEPRARYHGTNCEGVEADLIEMFEDRYGARPLRNRNSPSDHYKRHYDPEDLRVLHPGKGTGYEWGLTPLPSSHFYRE